MERRCRCSIEDIDEGLVGSDDPTQCNDKYPLSIPDLVTFIVEIVTSV